MNTYRLRDMYVCSILDLNAFIRTHTTNTETSEYAFFTKDRILTNVEYTTNEGITLDRIINVDDNLFSNYLPAISFGRIIMMPSELD